jgi:hypothetical protein
MKLLALLLFLVGCSSLVSTRQKLRPEVYYKNDICFTHNRDVAKHGNPPKTIVNRMQKIFNRKGKVQEHDFCGSGVLPYEDKYEITINHTSALNYLAINTCHREITSENPSKGIFKKSSEYVLTYNPSLEDGRACPLYVAAYNKTGAHGWGVIAFEHPDFTLPSKVHCNGDLTEYNGVSICESRFDLIQRIEFEEEVLAIRPVNGSAEREEDCPTLSTTDKKTFEFLMPNRECIYGFIEPKSNRKHKFYTIGYERLLVRE